jgi:hypothetical protein
MSVPHRLRFFDPDGTEAPAGVLRRRGTTAHYIESLESYYANRRTLDLAVVVVLVIVGSLWAEAVMTLLRKRVFHTESPSALQWATAAFFGSGLFLGAITILRSPVFLFA